MFKNPFSFEGRIRRTEYGLSLIFYAIASGIINTLIEESRGEAAILLLGYGPMLWFLWAQGAKRCHDVGNSGWWQLIPLYSLWLIFQDGQPGQNQYGYNPKEIHVTAGQPQQGGQNYPMQGNPTDPINPNGGYSGGYSGGHNNPSGNSYSSQRNSTSEGYKDGDIYK